MANPFVSFLVPTCDRRRLLERTVESVLSQTDPDLELIVVDDASADGTWGYLESLASTEPRVRVFRQAQRQGAPAARNRALRESLGEFINFLDSDDIVHPRKIDMQRRVATGVDGVLCQTVVFGDGSHPPKVWNVLETGEPYLDRFLRHDVAFHTSAPLWKRDLAVKVGGYDEGVRRAQDYEFHVRCLLERPSLSTIPYALNFYRQHGDARISTADHDHMKYVALVLDRLRGQVANRCASQERLSFAGTYLWVASGSPWSKRPGLVAKALSIMPWEHRAPLIRKLLMTGFYGPGMRAMLPHIGIDLAEKSRHIGSVEREPREVLDSFWPAEF